MKTFAGWVFGVVLPLVTIGVEAVTGMCAETFFDPLPTPLHFLLALCVPAANLVLLLTVQRGDPPRSALVLHGAALGVAAFYTLLFLPLLPIAFVGLLLLGLGILPLSPLLSFIATLTLARAHRAGGSHGWTMRPGSRGAGALLAVVLLFGVDVPTTVTRLALQKAASSDVDESRRGVGWLRAVGSRRVLLRLCYDRSGIGTDIVGFVSTLVSGPVETSKARQVYYQVTGTPFNSVPAPSMPDRTRRRWGRWDDDRGSDRVGGVVEHLSLASSRLDVNVDPVGALSYTEWTLELHNDTDAQQEARAQIQLPPGGVVTRLTLWIAGEEREAAFGSRGVVRQAYERVVQARRDPVLVTTSGPDRVMLQCFPVPPRGTMKTKVGITTALHLASLERGALSLPHFVERNFAVRDNPLHAVWAESTHPLRVPGPDVRLEPAPGGRYAARGTLRDDQLAGLQGRLEAERPPQTDAWVADTVPGETAVVSQTLVPAPAAPPSRLVLVIDGSRSLDGLASPIAASLDAIPDETPVLAIVAGDELRLSHDTPQPAKAARTEIERLLRTSRWLGGADNVPALVRAWDIAAAEEGAAIVWIHGPQPIVLEHPEALRQRWERRPAGPRLYSLAAKPGADRLLESLDGIAAARSVACHLPIDETLRSLFTTWSSPLEARRKRHNGRTAQGALEHRASAQLLRLWAHDEVLASLDGSPAGRKAATARAVRYRLVTPVSGAVVLETQQQYQEAGLDPDNPSQVSSVPEPEMWLLLAIAGAIVIWTMRPRRSGLARVA